MGSAEVLVCESCKLSKGIDLLVET
jgi:hypothetical protein